MLDPATSDSVTLTVLSRHTAIGLKSWIHPNRKATGLEIDGRTLPTQVGKTMAGDPRVLCLGPSEWLIVSDSVVDRQRREGIESQASRQDIALVDLTDGLAGLRINGVAARELLTKGCGLDLHPRVFPEGACARTRFAQVSVIFDCREPHHFILYVGRSYLPYLHSWLTDAALEFQTDTH